MSVSLNSNYLSLCVNKISEVWEENIPIINLSKEESLEGFSKTFCEYNYIKLNPLKNNEEGLNFILKENSEKNKYEIIFFKDSFQLKENTLFSTGIYNKIPLSNIKIGSTTLINTYGDNVAKNLYVSFDGYEDGSNYLLSIEFDKKTEDSSYETTVFNNFKNVDFNNAEIVFSLGKDMLTSKNGNVVNCNHLYEVADSKINKTTQKLKSTLIFD